MNIGAGGMQQSPLFMALQSQNMAGAQQEQLSEEERRKKMAAILAGLDSGWNQIHQSNFNKYSLAGAQAGNVGAYGVSDYM